MYTKQAWWSILALIGGSIYPVIHALLTVPYFDFLEIQILILRIWMFFAFFTFVMAIISMIQWVRKVPAGTFKLQTRVSGKLTASSRALLLLPIALAGLCISTAELFGGIWIASISRWRIYGFATFAFGIFFWLVISGISAAFVYVVLRPIIRTLKLNRPKKKPPVKVEKDVITLQQITSPPTLVTKPVGKQEIPLPPPSNAAEDVKCLACGSTNPAGSKQCHYCQSPL